jgi:hypothetical protein
VIRSKNGLGGFDSFKSQNGSWCKKDDTPKTQTAANPSQQLQNVFNKHEILIALVSIFVQQSIARMGSEASTAKARTADGAKKKALQKIK